VILETPAGTEVYDFDTGDLIVDLTLEDQEILLIQGGKGGKGNRHFATSTNRTPRMAQPGLPGRERKIRLSLKCLADIGLVGFPNAGKSTLISRLTKAQPKIDSYPFTTISPNLGVIAFEDGNVLTIADIPGLIRGASQGRGLGHRFLKHVERTGMLLHLLDLSYHPESHILEDFEILRNEMERYSPALTKKAQLVLINKIDLDSPDCRDIGELQTALRASGFESLPISALKGDGLETLKELLAGKLLDD
jgi:GTP-binding protein